MKTILMILLVIGALMLIGSNSVAQTNIWERDWIDSLARQYRGDYIKSVLDRDRSALNGLRLRVDSLNFEIDTVKELEKNSKEELVRAKRAYKTERSNQRSRKRDFKKEI